MVSHNELQKFRNARMALLFMKMFGPLQMGRHLVNPIFYVPSKVYPGSGVRYLKWLAFLYDGVFPERACDRTHLLNKFSMASLRTRFTGIIKFLNK